MRSALRASRVKSSSFTIWWEKSSTIPTGLYTRVSGNTVSIRSTSGLQDADISLDNFTDTGSLDLKGNLGPVFKYCGMHLGKRCRSNRFFIDLRRTSRPDRDNSLR